MLGLIGVGEDSHLRSLLLHVDQASVHIRVAAISLFQDSDCSGGAGCGCFRDAEDRFLRSGAGCYSQLCFGASMAAVV